jgi:hypothetical protein
MGQDTTATKPQTQPQAADSLKVLSLHLQEGGIQLGSFGTRNHLEYVAPDERPGKPAGALTTVEMVFARSLGGVVVTWQDRGTVKKLLVPVAHIRAMALE